MKKDNFIIWWVALWYNLLPVIFFASWYLYSNLIAVSLPKANGEPFNEIGMLCGIIPAFITMLITKIFIYDNAIKKYYKHKQ